MCLNSCRKTRLRTGLAGMLVLSLPFPAITQPEADCGAEPASCETGDASPGTQPVGNPFC